MSNYNTEHEPTDINKLILEHINIVMDEECETKADTWTLKKILSWERFGMTICKSCHDNREKLLYKLIPKYKQEYDYTGIIQRGVTKYRDLPYKLKCFIQGIAMNNVRLSTWTPDDMYAYGRKFYMRETEMSEVDDLKISNEINERNIEYLINRFSTSLKCGGNDC
jgi:hypothetical protein